MHVRAGYFKKYYPFLQLPIGDDSRVGLRRAQLGAYHAIASHFTLNSDPALIIMPTGSGKTAVLMMTAFQLQAQRVLVITPSVLVRRQISDRFGSLSTLRNIGVVVGSEKDFPGPNVFEVDKKMREEADWNELRQYEVVVGTPLSLSPRAGGVCQPPEDLFDLILIDEAHHGRAKTWQALLDAFPEARQVHFTATPFRRDDKPLSAKIIYSFPLSEAHKDGIFSQIIWEQVTPTKIEDADTAIASKTEEVFKEERQTGNQHLVMVRTDSKRRASELKDIYEAETNLNLRLVHSGLAKRTIQNTIDDLQNFNLDGIICVDMLGEGFDLPSLKIAAVHSPHKSLAATLQFVGRFARTESKNGEIGHARFIAIPSQIEIETVKLYEDCANVWQDIVTGLSEQRIQEEKEIREQLGTFERVVEAPANLRDVSPHAFRPHKHVKIYKVLSSVDSIDITSGVQMPKNYEVVERWNSSDLATTIFVTQERTRPEWTSLEQLDKIEYDLFVIYHDRDANLLFINASRRSNSLYEHIAQAFTDGNHRILPMSQINNVLATLTDFHFFNIGMRRRGLHPQAETYQIKTGSNTQESVRPSDGMMYDRGHVSCIAKNSDGKEEFIGYSSSSKVWNPETSLVPQLIEWAHQLSIRIKNYQDVQTGSGIDLLSIGEELNDLPDDIIGVDWPSDAYVNGRQLIDHSTGDTNVLANYDIEIDRSESNNGTVKILIIGASTSYEIDHTISERGPQFFNAQGNSNQAFVKVGREEVPLHHYFQEHSPSFFRADFSAIREGQLFKVKGDINPFDESQFTVVSWLSEGVDIKKEFFKADEVVTSDSIHSYLERTLPAQDNKVVFYDHGTGELADFVTFIQEDKNVLIQFYHCKGSSERKPGSRVNDVYEVASQVIKSMIWIKKGPEGIADKILYRDSSREGSWFCKGTDEDIGELIDIGKSIGFSYEMILVQPGLSKSKMKGNVTNSLGAADKFIIDNNCLPLRVWGSE